MFYAEFEPGVLIFLLWGLLSFLSRSKKKDDIPFKFDLSKESDNIQDISFDEQANNQSYFSESLEKGLESVSIHDKGEIVEITVTLRDTAPAAGCLEANESWKVEVYPRDGAIVSVQGKTPVELAQNMMQ